VLAVITSGQDANAIGAIDLAQIHQGLRLRLSTAISHAFVTAREGEEVPASLPDGSFGTYT
jgi:hypothetical protein